MTDNPHEYIPPGKMTEKPNKIADIMIFAADQQTIIVKLEQGLALMEQDYQDGLITDEDVEKFLKAVEILTVAARSNIEHAKADISETLSPDTRVERFTRFLRCYFK